VRATTSPGRPVENSEEGAAVSKKEATSRPPPSGLTTPTNDFFPGETGRKNQITVSGSPAALQRTALPKNEPPVPRAGQVSLAGLAPAAAIEVLFGLQQRTRQGVKTYCAILRPVANDARTQLGVPEVRWGLLPGAGGTQRLPRLAGFEPAMNLLLSGRSIAPVDAVRLGIFARTVPAATLVDTAKELAG